MSQPDPPNSPTNLPSDELTADSETNAVVLDMYDGFDAEAERVARLFADPTFKIRERQRQAAEALTPIKRRTSGGSVGHALALGFANVFDPDRQRDDIVAMQERADDDDVPDTHIDPDDPTTTRVVYKAGPDGSLNLGFNSDPSVHRSAAPGQAPQSPA